MIAARNLTAFTLPIGITNNQQPLQGHFRSKLFVVDSTTNPLLAAAEPLLSLIERLNIAQKLPDIDSFHENIEHELCAFRSKLASLNYAEDLAAIAYYLLTATIDELLGKNYLRLYNTTATFTAFTQASVDSLGPEHHVFRIINILKEQTSNSLNVLELAYYCLITGFEGEYHMRADGRQALENLIEELHQLIRQDRVTLTYRPFKNTTIVAQPKSNHYKVLTSLWLTTILLISGSYYGGNNLLTQKTKQVLHSIPKDI